MPGETKTESDSDIESEFPYLGNRSLAQLSHKQKTIFAGTWKELITYLREQGKNPERNFGYAESNLPPTARRIFQLHQYCWQNGPTKFKLSSDDADEFVKALNNDEVLTNEGEPYAEDSKRKFVDAVHAYFNYRGIDWDSPIEFENNTSDDGSDPFTSQERELLFEAALEFQTLPNYKNVTPEERDNWNTYLSQRRDKPKDEIGPSDWKEVSRSWKVPALIALALDIGARAALINRLKLQHLDLENGQVIIDGETAVKNDISWTNQLTNRTVTALREWLKQRANKAKYYDSDYIWLNRKGNPYESKPLNSLLRNLIEASDIKPNARKLTWHSIRHSTGMYIYDERGDVVMVAETLRHASVEAARKYCHPTPESKQNVLESIQGGGSV